MLEPRVARGSQPWAEGCNPFGIAQDVQWFANPGRSAVFLSSFGGEGQGEEAVVLKLILLKFISFHTVGPIRPD